MIIRIDPHNGVPVYRQILDQVRFHITAGILQPGEPLDSVRDLAAALGINSMTVSKAYSLLEHDGDIERRRGQQLIVAAAHPKRHDASREDHVREALAPAVTVVHQLGMPNDDALEIFRDLLGEKTQPKEKPHATRR
jgi:GntR family transcriptional regulator